MDITIVTTAQTDEEALEFLKLNGNAVCRRKVIYGEEIMVRAQKKRRDGQKVRRDPAELKPSGTIALSKLPRNASPTRIVNRCKMSAAVTAICASLVAPV